jgi:oligopeptide/dipeptide ABC transporter ATP-binding protein
MPTLLLADEATTSLDVTTQAQIMDLVQDLVRTRDMALVVITHDIALAASYVDEIYVMYAGRFVEHAPVGKLIADPRMPYTKALLSAVPGMAGIGLPVAIPGQPPDLGALGNGCPFRPRCSDAVDQCDSAEPELRIAEDGRSAACWVC